MPKRTFEQSSSGSATSRILASARKRLAAKRTTPALRGRVAAGYTRRSGYYGRFAGPAGELKFFDTALAFSADATAEVPATGQLVLIPQGVTESTRVGRKCTIKSIAMRIQATFVPAAAATASGLVTIILVQDTQCNGAAAVPADVFSPGTSLVVDPINMSNSSRFKVLKRWVMNFNATAGATTAYNNSNKFISMYRKMNMPLEYSSTTGAITELRSNNLFLLAQSGGLIDDLVTIAGVCRVRFSDN